ISFAQPGDDQSGDQEARDHEEHVDAGEAAGHRARIDVERDDERDCDGAQAINVFAISEMHDARFPEVRERASVNGAGPQPPILSSKNTRPSMQLRQAPQSSEPAKAVASASAVIPVYVISLPNAEARRRNMTLRLEAVGIPFTFVDALYGRTIPIPDHLDGARVVRARFKTESGLGCTVSHRLLHRTIAEGDAETALILEDDATIPEHFAEVIAQALAFDFDVFKLEGVNAWNRRLTVGRVGQYEVIITSRPSVGSAAYLLRRDAARHICSLPVLDQGSDYVFQDPRLRLRVLEMHPFCVQ